MTYDNTAAHQGVTPICTIRPWRPSDAAAVTAILADPRIRANLRDGIPYPYTLAHGEAFIAQMLAADPDAVFAFAIVAKNQVVGSIAAYRGANIHRRTAELGYYLASSHWGQGIMTEAVRLLCDHVFTHSDILRIYAEPFAHNLASQRVLEKAGFQYEGTMRWNAVKDGTLTDMRLYALLRGDDGATISH